LKARLIFLAITLFILAGSMFLDSCSKSTVEVPTTPLPFTIPPGFPSPVYNFSSNPLSEEGFLLGRKLFYDGRLSADGRFSCGSCHQQVAAFTTFEHDRSHGSNNSHTLRNAPALANLAWYPLFNQDGSASNLEAVYLKHITDPTEMAENMNNVINKLKADTSYQRMFRQAFGNDKVTQDRVFNALSQFVVSLVSANSKYDRVKAGKAMFSQEEQNGYAVFQQKCSGCHTEPLFTDFSYRNAGLELDPQLKDYGRMRVTGSRADSLKFRVPSLRNAELSSYYTHDGRLSMMRMMIWHYRYNVKPGPTLDPSLANGIQLTDQQENALVAFLRTLTDSSYIANPRFRE
jgi:cytochrome c peroxidase